MNKVILMGRLTKDPELRYTSGNNTAVCSFTIAVNRRFTKEAQADFFNIVAWEKTAEFCGKYFAKGQQVGIIGRLQTRTWDDNEGKRHYVTEVVAEETYFADSKRGEGSAAPAGGRSYQDAPAPAGDGFYPMDDDDELPF